MGKSTASFMVKEEMKQDKINSENKDNNDDSKESLDNVNIEFNNIENVITDEIINGNDSTNICGVLNLESNTSDIVDTTEVKDQVSKPIEVKKETYENVKEVNKEKKDPNTSSTERKTDSK